MVREYVSESKQYGVYLELVISLLAIYAVLKKTLQDRVCIWMGTADLITGHPVLWL